MFLQVKMPYLNLANELYKIRCNVLKRFMKCINEEAFLPSTSSKASSDNYSLNVKFWLFPNVTTCLYGPVFLNGNVLCLLTHIIHFNVYMLLIQITFLINIPLKCVCICLYKLTILDLCIRGKDRIVFLLILLKWNNFIYFLDLDWRKHKIVISPFHASVVIWFLTERVIKAAELHHLTIG